MGAPSGAHCPSPVPGLGEGEENREIAMAFGLHSGVQTESVSPHLLKVNALITEDGVPRWPESRGHLEENDTSDLKRPSTL